jgi:2-oxoglutarate dehydrogenase E2 component (dihydrolipoamide succinyltransferase)
MLCELETDKVTVEVPAPAAGTLGEIVAPEGTTVGVAALLATITEGAAAAPPAAAPAAAAEARRDGPDTGRERDRATVSTWFKAAGDSVAQAPVRARDQGLVENAPSAGVLMAEGSKGIDPATVSAPAATAA